MHSFYELEDSVQNVDKEDNKKIDIQSLQIDDFSSIIENESLLNKKKRLKEIVKDLNRFELLEVFNIFKDEKCSYTENTNGIFINITNVCEEVIDRVYRFIEYIKQKSKELNEHDELIRLEKEKIKDINKLNEESYDNYIFNKNFINQIQENKLIDVLSDNEEEHNYTLDLSSDDENEDGQNLEDKFLLKKKKIKYTGTKAKIMKSYRENKENNLTSKKKSSKDKKENENTEVETS